MYPDIGDGNVVNSSGGFWAIFESSNEGGISIMEPLDLQKLMFMEIILDY